MRDGVDMRVKQIFRTVIIFILLASNIGCDQISKSIARQNLDYHEPVSVVNDYFTLILVENTGAFLSLGGSWPEPVRIVILTIIPLMVLVLATLYLLTARGLSYVSLVAVSFVIGGGIGNIYDRLVYGSVTDFLHLDLGIFATGIFNMADVSILTGVFAVGVESYLKRRRLNAEISDGADPS